TSVNHRPGYLGDLRDPSAIFFLLDLDSEGHDPRRSTKGDENSNLFIPRLTKISFSIRWNSKNRRFVFSQNVQSEKIEQAVLVGGSSAPTGDANSTRLRRPFFYHGA